MSASPFSKESFNLLEGLVANNEQGWFTPGKAELKASLQAPLRRDARSGVKEDASGEAFTVKGFLSGTGNVPAYRD
ncbi:MAG: hypothetical protein AAFN70_02230 [Planctomycetota bacterium]